MKTLGLILFVVITFIVVAATIQPPFNTFTTTINGNGQAITNVSSITFNASSSPTNLMPIANAPDFAVAVSLFSTNNVLQFQAPTNVDATKKFYQSCIVWVTNVGPTANYAIIAPVNCRTNGRALSIPFVTNLSIVTFYVYPNVGTNMKCEPVF